MGDVSRGRSGSPDREMEKEYQKYRARYEQLRDDLMRRDRQVQSDPFAMARWPSERKVFSDRVEHALTEWEVFGHNSQIEARRPGTRQDADPEPGSVESDSGVEKPPAPEDC